MQPDGFRKISVHDLPLYYIFIIKIYTNTYKIAT